MIDQLVFQKHLENQKAVRIFEDGSEDDKINFCKKYLQDRGGKVIDSTKAAEPKEILFEKPVSFTMKKSISVLEWEQEDFREYFRRNIYNMFADSFMCEMKKLSKYIKITEETNYGTDEKIFTMKMYVTKPKDENIFHSNGNWSKK